MTPLELLAGTAHRSPHHMFLQTDEGRCSYDEFYCRVSERLADVLSVDAVALAVTATRTIEGLVAMFAVLASGKMCVPIDAALPSARLTEICETFDVHPLPGPDMGNGAAKASVAGSMAQGERLVLGIMTSGSSGVPKLVAHRFQSLMANVRASAAMAAMTPHSRTLLSLPLYHIGGFAQVLRALHTGSSLVMQGRVEDPETLNNHKITHCSMVATQLQRLLNVLAGTDTGDSRGIPPGLRAPMLPHLRHVLLGGGPCAEETLQAARQVGIPVRVTYGLSETASQLVTQDDQGVGQIVGATEVQLAENGEIRVRGETLFAGYWRAGKLDSARDAEGWFHTRDLGVWRGGCIRILGRLDNQFISGGKNIQPEEIERHLVSLPSVSIAVVVPVPHREFGEVPLAFVDLAEGELTQALQRDWVARLKQVLPGYLVPRCFARLPTQRGLKIQRDALKIHARSLDTNL
ncbi:AMP-binding protein [Teredinibacter turnerae]|uniref:AMP-binding protein n=1 Tax=Teredinibacter turnerae TaxID=2426 RepID=UPI00036BE625|nr:AMP-binding protein [Teredinibacter turnerae]